MAGESLSDFVETVCGEGHLRVEDDLGDGFVRLRSSEAERRQAAQDIRSTEDIVIEMLRNARDANAKSIFVAATREGSTRRIVMVDDGDGIPESMHGRVFEPRVTSKLDTAHMDKWGVHGRGMALYSIAVNAKSAFVATSAPGKGASFVVETDTSKLPEKVDQSTFPTFELTESGTVSVRGPRNILRTVCEFCLEHRKDCTVYLGSATEIAATLYAFGAAVLTHAARAFCPDPMDLPACKRLAVAADPAHFVELAESLGISVSERSARRIMDGNVAPLAPLIDRVTIAHSPDSTSGQRTRVRSSSNTGDDRGLKIDTRDLDGFTARISTAYRDLARAYYLQPDVAVEVHVSRDAVRISIPVEKLR